MSSSLNIIFPILQVKWIFDFLKHLYSNNADIYDFKYLLGCHRTKTVI